MAYIVIVMALYIGAEPAAPCAHRAVERAAAAAARDGVGEVDPAVQAAYIVMAVYSYGTVQPWPTWLWPV